MIEFLVGIVGNLIASSAFILLLRRLRPNIAISPQICRATLDGGDVIYEIKVINRARRSAIDVRAELELSVSTPMPEGGLIEDFETLAMTKESLFSLPPFDDKDNTFSYAYRFSTEIDVEKSWNDKTGGLLVFRLYAKDELSGFGRVFTVIYGNRADDMKDGEFVAGNTLVIWNTTS